MAVMTLEAVTAPAVRTDAEPNARQPESQNKQTTHQTPTRRGRFRRRTPPLDRLGRANFQSERTIEQQTC